MPESGKEAFWTKLTNWFTNWLDWFKDLIIHFLLSLKEITYVMDIVKYRSWNYHYESWDFLQSVDIKIQNHESPQNDIVNSLSFFQGLLALATWGSKSQVDCSWTAVLLQDMKIVCKVMWCGDKQDPWWWISNNIGR